ncbi:hypothetical protein Ancab_031559 [Ancistrocladus abbreviatus]
MENHTVKSNTPLNLHNPVFGQSNKFHPSKLKLTFASNTGLDRIHDPEQCTVRLHLLER